MSDSGRPPRVRVQTDRSYSQPIGLPGVIANTIAIANADGPLTRSPVVMMTLCSLGASVPAQLPSSITYTQITSSLRSHSRTAGHDRTTRRRLVQRASTAADPETTVVRYGTAHRGCVIVEKGCVPPRPAGRCTQAFFALPFSFLPSSYSGHFAHARAGSPVSLLNDPSSRLRWWAAVLRDVTSCTPSPRIACGNRGEAVAHRASAGDAAGLPSSLCDLRCHYGHFGVMSRFIRP